MGCDNEVTDGTNGAPGEDEEYATTQTGRKSRKLMGESRTVNVHNLGRHFVEQVLDVRRTPVADQNAGREGETLQFLAQVRGWQGVQAEARKEWLLGLNDWSLASQLTLAADKHIFCIPQEHYPRDQPENGEPGWWYRVERVATCRQCIVCDRRKVQAEFTCEDWNKRGPIKCSQCKGEHQRLGRRRQSEKKRKYAQDDSRWGCNGGRHLSGARDREEVNLTEPTTERRSKRERKSQRASLGDRQDSESEADHQDEEWTVYQAQKCVTMSPANPRYVGRGDDNSGGEVTYTMQEMRALLRSQSGGARIWLTTSQMGWSLFTEQNEIRNARDELEGKITARSLAPVISTYIRGLGEEAISSASQERRAILMEARLLDQAWGIWDDQEVSGGEEEEQARPMPEGTNEAKQHAMATITQRRREWESPSYSLVRQDPHLLPDSGLSPRVGRDFFLDEKIPRDVNGKGYVGVTETSVLWKESETAKLFTYQGLTSCMEPDQTWTIMGSMWHLLRKKAGRTDGDLIALVHNEVAYQDKLEAAGYRSPSWRILRALQGLQQATQLQGESAVSAPPFFACAGRGQKVFWGQTSGPTVFLWESLDAEGRKTCEEVVNSRKDWVVWSRTRPRPTEEQERVFVAAGKAVFEGKILAAQCDGRDESAEELPDGEMEDEQTGSDRTGGKACRQRGWWKTGNVAASGCPAGMTAWVHRDHCMVDQTAVESLQQAWECTEGKDECSVEMTGLERDYWLGSEAGRIGGYEFQGAVFGIDGSNHGGCMGSGCCRLHMPSADQQVRVGREEEGTSSNRPELGGVVLALRQAELSEDVLILCDNESVLKVINKWVGQGGRATLANAPDADILREILELIRARIEAGRATFLVKVKSHRGEPLNEQADTLAEKGRARPEEEKRWDERTDRMTFTVGRQSNTKTSVWTDSVRNAFRKQAGRSKVQDVYAQAARNWFRRVWYPRNQRWMQSTRPGRVAAKDGKFKDEQAWGKACFEDLERRELGEPATTSWSTDFLVREGESREELGKWLRNRAVPWKRRRRLIQVVTDTFPCGGWLHKIGRRATAECELCRRIQERSGRSGQDRVPVESIGHIQSAGCAGQSEAVTAAHNKCIRGLMSDIQVNGRKKSHLTFLTMEEEHTIGTLWKQDGCDAICSREELWHAAKDAEMLIPLQQGEGEPDALESQYEERFWKRRLDGIAIDTVGKKCYLIEFKRTRDRRHSYEERAREVARRQYKSLLSGLRVVEQQKGWKVEQLVFVGGTCGSVNVETFNQNLKLLEVPESKWNHIRRRMARRLLEEQDTVLRAYFAQKYDTTSECGGEGSSVAEPQGLAHVGRDVYA